jgi:hypothetical protein
MTMERLRWWPATPRGQGRSSTRLRWWSAWLTGDVQHRLLLVWQKLVDGRHRVTQSLWMRPAGGCALAGLLLTASVSQASPMSSVTKPQSSVTKRTPQCDNLIHIWT